VFNVLFLLIAFFSIDLSATSRLEPLGTWFEDGHFEFDEELNLSQEIVDVISLEGGSSILDLGYVDGTLSSLASISLITYEGKSPYNEAVIRSLGDADLLDPTQFFDLGTTYDWVVCLGLGGFFSQGTEAALIDNISRHATSGVIVTWFSPIHLSPNILSPLTESEIETLFLAEGLTRDLVTEQILRASANPLNFWPQILYVFRK